MQGAHDRGNGRHIARELAVLVGLILLVLFAVFMLADEARAEGPGGEKELVGVPRIGVWLNGDDFRKGPDGTRPIDAKLTAMVAARRPGTHLFHATLTETHEAWLLQVVTALEGAVVQGHRVLYSCSTVDKCMSALPYMQAAPDVGFLYDLEDGLSGADMADPCGSVQRMATFAHANGRRFYLYYPWGAYVLTRPAYGAVEGQCYIDDIGHLVDGWLVNGPAFALDHWAYGVSIAETHGLLSRISPGVPLILQLRMERFDRLIPGAWDGLFPEGARTPQGVYELYWQGWQGRYDFMAMDYADERHPDPAMRPPALYNYFLEREAAGSVAWYAR